MDEIDERLRSMKIQRGIDPDVPEPSLDGRRARTERLRRQNDEAAAAIRRRATMKVVDS